MVFTVLPGPAMVSIVLEGPDQNLHIGHSFPFISAIFVYCSALPGSQGKPDPQPKACSLISGQHPVRSLSLLSGWDSPGCGAPRPACAAGAWRPGRSPVLSQRDAPSWSPGLSRAQQLTPVGGSTQWTQEDVYPQSDVLAKDTLLRNVRRRMPPHPHQVRPDPLPPGPGASLWNRTPSGLTFLCEGTPTRRTSTHIHQWCPLAPFGTWPFEVGSPGHSVQCGVLWLGPETWSHSCAQQ